MAEIVELRDMRDEDIEALLESAHEEMFNLRFQQASARLKNTARLKEVRRDIARCQTVLRNRQQAISAAADIPEVAGALAGIDWNATARFDYEESAWLVSFVDDGNDELASAKVNLNKKRVNSRHDRTAGKQAQLVVAYEIAE